MQSIHNPICIREPKIPEAALLFHLHLFSGLGPSTKPLTLVAVNAEDEPIAGLWEKKYWHSWEFDIAVSELYRRKGIGKKLLEIAVKHAQAQNLEARPFLTTEAGKALWKTLVK